MQVFGVCDGDIGAGSKTLADLHDGKTTSVFNVVIKSWLEWRPEAKPDLSVLLWSDTAILTYKGVIPTRKISLNNKF